MVKESRCRTQRETKKGRGPHNVATAEVGTEAHKILHTAMGLLEHDNVVAIQKLEKVFPFLGGKGGALGKKASRVPRGDA